MSALDKLLKAVIVAPSHEYVRIATTREVLFAVEDEFSSMQSVIDAVGEWRGGEEYVYCEHDCFHTDCKLARAYDNLPDEYKKGVK
jgi:hypothetical protein